MNTTTATKKCDRKACPDTAAWSYRVSTFAGVETIVSCQGHVKEIRSIHGANILSVRDIR